MTWANQRVFAACATLPDDALDAYIINPEWKAGRILQHIVGGATWYVYCLGIADWEDIPALSSTADLRDLAAMLERFDILIASAAHLPDELLEFQDENGAKRVLRSTILAQAIHHATEHRAQLMDALESRGHNAINLDDIDFWAFEATEG